MVAGETVSYGRIYSLFHFFYLFFSGALKTLARSLLLCSVHSDDERVQMRRLSWSTRGGCLQPVRAVPRPSGSNISLPLRRSPGTGCVLHQRAFRNTCSWENQGGDKLKARDNYILKTRNMKLIFVKAMTNQIIELIFRLKSFCDKHLISREKFILIH